MTAHDSGWRWWLTFFLLPDFHRLHCHQLAWRTDGRTLHVRKATRAEASQQAIYDALGIDSAPGGISKTLV